MEKRRLDKEEVMEMFDRLVVDMNIKPPEVKDAEGAVIREKVEEGKTLYDGWSAAFETDDKAVEGTLLPKRFRKTLEFIGRYSPVSMKGIRNSVFKRLGKSAPAHLQALEMRRLVMVTEDELGRSVWSITEKGIKELGTDYIPRKQ